MTRKMLLTLGLLAVLLLSACTPTVSAPTLAPDSGGVEEPAPAQEEMPAVAAPASTEVPAETEVVVEEPQGMPTSRGAQLVATDPSTVNLTSGQPQLIEFFAFW